MSLNEEVYDMHSTTGGGFSWTGVSTGKHTATKGFNEKMAVSVRKSDAKIAQITSEERQSEV